jgi:hypothetical protein
VTGVRLSMGRGIESHLGYREPTERPERASVPPDRRIEEAASPLDDPRTRCRSARGLRGFRRHLGYAIGDVRKGCADKGRPGRAMTGCMRRSRPRLAHPPPRSGWAPDPLLRGRAISLEDAPDIAHPEVSGRSIRISKNHRASERWNSDVPNSIVSQK